MMRITVHRIQALVVLHIVTLSALGCSQATDEPSVNAAPQVDCSKYVLVEEPAGAIGVIDARESSRNGDEIVLIGRIGGSKRPWIEGRSAFMVIDASMAVVSDGQESASGELCLDDCCASLRAECTTLVKFVDDAGSVLRVDSRDILKAEVGELVVVRGQVQRDAKQGTFVVLASGVHVRR